VRSGVRAGPQPRVIPQPAGLRRRHETGAALGLDPSDAPELDDPVEFGLSVGLGSGDLSMRLPSGVVARLNGVGGEFLRVGKISEETLVWLGGETVEFVRRAGAERTVFECSLSRQGGSEAIIRRLEGAHQSTIPILPVDSSCSGHAASSCVVTASGKHLDACRDQGGDF
jgi:hypothetical protein